MGRLTLNVLLSFAQFEREVGAERVRDKIAASKKKGMWMGGVCPLGYDVRGRALVVNEAEAAVVRTIFETYLRLGSVLALEAELRGQGITSKLRTARTGEQTGGKPLSRGALYVMLRNALYVGRVPHAGQTYPGQHPPILDEETFARTEQLLNANTVARRAEISGAGEGPLLTGKLFDQHGRRMSPSYTSKGVKRYRYYISRPDDQKLCSEPIVRVPAGELENTVIARLQALLLDARALHDTCEEAQLGASELNSVLENAKTLCSRLGSAHTERAQLIQRIVSCVHLSPEDLRITGDLQALSSGKTPLSFDLTIPCKLVRRTKEVRLIVPPAVGSGPRHDPGLIKLLVRAHQVRRRFDQCGSMAVADLAAELGYQPDYCTVLLKLSYLSPELAGLILSGQQPQQLTRQRLARVRVLPAVWTEQTNTVLPLADHSEFRINSSK